MGAHTEGSSLSDKPFFYTESAPPPALAPFVLAFWAFEVRAPRGTPLTHHIWPDGCISLSVASMGGQMLGSRVVGPTVQTRQLPMIGGMTVCGVRLWPDAGHALLGLDPGALRDAMPDSVPLFGDSFASAVANVAARSPEEGAAPLVPWLEMRAGQAGSLDLRVRTAVERVVQSRGALSIRQLAVETGLSERQLQRRFRARVGLTPKEFSRVRRARSVLVAALRGDQSWSMVAAELGYADQAHLIRDTTALIGGPPTRVEDRLDAIEHGTILG